MPTVVIDTNVVLVANGRHSDVSPSCVATCAQRLQAVMDHGRLALDSGFVVLREYQNKCTPNEGRGPGDAFVKWALRNNANVVRIDCVHLEHHGERGYQSFPEDAELADFDRSDRVFVAVAALHADSPPILQASDSKWLGWAPALARCGVTVDFLCKADIEAFQKSKAKP